MKNIFLFLAVVAFTGCTERHDPKVQHPGLGTTNLPPTDFEFTVNDRPECKYEVVMTEEQIYQHSLDQLRSEMEDENLQLQMCAEAHGSKDNVCCKELRKNFCTTDQLVDSRGGRHKKPYCKALTR